MVWIATGKRAGTILKGAREESIRQKNDVVAHFDRELQGLKLGEGGADFKAEIDGVKAHIQGIDDALGAKFIELDQVIQALPARVAQVAGSVKGVEMKALYAEAVEGEEELESYVVDGMDPMDVAMAKVSAIEPNEEWKGKHPLGAMLVEAGKEFFKAKIDEQRGTLTMKKVGGGGRPKGFR